MCELVASTVGNLIPDSWAGFLITLAEACSLNGKNIEKFGLGIIETQELCIIVCKLRLTYAVASVQAIGCGEARLTNDDFQSIVDAATRILATDGGRELCLADLACRFLLPCRAGGIA